MNYAQIRSMDISNGKGIGVSIFFSGCNFHCKNCFNSELWSPYHGKPFTDKEIKKIICLLNREYIERLSILGGDPLMEYNLDAVLKLIEEVRLNCPTKKIWLYSGYTWEEIFSTKNTDKISDKRKKIIKKCDIFVDGKYIDTLKNLNLEFRGSSNQRIIDVKKTLEYKKVIELSLD